MREKKNKKNIIIYFLEMLLVFLLLDFFMIMISSIVAESSLIYKYGKDLILEIFYSISILIVMLLYKNSYVFTEKKEKFLNGIFLALPMFIISLINFGSNIMNIDNFSILSFLNMLIFCIFIGIAEEFLCRGWIQNEFIERFSSNKKETILSIALASFIFGFMHITNLSEQTLFETILQIVNATALGFLLGSVYYKTKNIWSVIFLHAFYDFSIFIGEIDLIKDCTYNNPTLSITIAESIGIIAVSLLWIFSAISVLNKCNFDERPKKSNNTIINIIVVLTFIIVMIPFSNFVDGYDDYLVCYKYNEIDEFNDYDIVYPMHDKYSIINKTEYDLYDLDNIDNSPINDYSFEVYKENNETLVIKNTTTNYEKKYTFNELKYIEVIEYKDSFIIAVLTNENESTIYFSDYLNKNSMSNENDYLNNIAFSSYVLPKISLIGYINVYEKDEKYIYLLSENNDEFVIVNSELFVIKK